MRDRGEGGDEKCDHGGGEKRKKETTSIQHKETLLRHYISVQWGVIDNSVSLA
jgi:hypothetical protein